MHEPCLYQRSKGPHLGGWLLSKENSLLRVSLARDQFHRALGRWGFPLDSDEYSGSIHTEETSLSRD